ncbi:threonine ammonia-lyase [Chrysiogenes arsenatis]|uniref:threonine ammonia-lyase n=1 Tax=Chrysiogenes arsenatis TaxID=309797 RepID=UPI000420F0AD|nr:threonine ammonia-lyase [Chrysiogenes arsenatis]
MTQTPQKPSRLDLVHEAQKRLCGEIINTPLLHSKTFSHMAHTNVFLKLENLQYTGAFKERGALNKILTLDDAQRQRGIIAASAGNHAQGVAYHCQRLGLPCTIVMPEHTPLIKVSNVRYHGAEVILHGGGYDDAYQKATTIGDERNLTFVHPFDDLSVIAGQGTIGLEILATNPDIDTVVIPVGGGGLASGIGIAVRETAPHIKIYGVQSAHAPAMYHSFKEGNRVEIASEGTIADGIAVKTPGDLTHYLLGMYLDDMFTVNDDEVAKAILNMLEIEKMVVEGAGVAALAAVISGKIPCGTNTAVIISGGNIDVTLLSRIINLGLTKTGRQTKIIVALPNRVGELHRVTGVLREMGASIVQALHDHSYSIDSLRVLDSAVEFTLETRGHDHIEAIYAALRGQGYRVYHPATRE